MKFYAAFFILEHLSLHNQLVLKVNEYEGVYKVTIPDSRQTVHMMNWCDVLRVLWKMRRNDGRTVSELVLYTTDDLRRLYHQSDENSFFLTDGIVDRVELVAVIRWRIFWARFGYLALFVLTLIAAVAAVIAAIEGWRWPV